MSEHRYRLLANTVMVFHWAWTLLMIVGIALVTKYAWYAKYHLMIVGSTAALSVIRGDCVLTTWEERLRQKYDSTISFRNSFLATYISSWTPFRVSQQQVERVSVIVKTASIILATKIFIS